MKAVPKSKGIEDGWEDRLFEIPGAGTRGPAVPRDAEFNLIKVKEIKPQPPWLGTGRRARTVCGRRLSSTRESTPVGKIVGFITANGSNIKRVLHGSEEHG
eukprot:9494285-Pyramimonas_sp.AAC.1